MRKVLVQAWPDLDEIVEAFECAWREGLPAEIVSFLPDRDHPRFLEVLFELARVDLELRWESAQPHPLTYYLDQFPEIRDDAEALSKLAFEEYRQRRHAGEQPDANEYSARYSIATEKWTAGVKPPAIPHVLPDFDKLASTVVVPQRPLAALDASQIAQRLPGFALECELGRGAFSRVFLARQQGLANRLVVLKISTECFFEADKMARLQHAHIVPVYSVHQAGDLFAVCMPYFGAATLADLVGKLADVQSLPPSGRIVADTLTARAASTFVAGQKTAPSGSGTGQSLSSAVHHHPADVGTIPLDSETSSSAGTSSPVASSPATYLTALSGLSYVDAVLSIAQRLADGLSHAHSCGIVHRDLKPANVLLANDGRPMLLDFNLSEDLQAAAGDRGPLVGGTLPYMAPEQLLAFQRCSTARDPRSDVYSLGVILYELLTGRQPFPARPFPAGGRALDELLPAMLQDRAQRPLRVRKLNHSVSPAVEALVQHCLEPELSARYQSAAELQEDLQRQLAHLPLRHVREPSLAERLRKWARRHPRLTSATGIAALAAIQILVLTLVLSVRSSQLAKLDAAAALREFQNDLQSVQLKFLDDSRLASDQADDIHDLSRHALQQFSLFDPVSREPVSRNPGSRDEDSGAGETVWPTSARYRNLSAIDQDRLRADAGELLFLMAAVDRIRAERAESADQRAEILRDALEWNRRATECCQAGKVPGAFWSQRSELLSRLGQADAARHFAEFTESTTADSPRDQCLLACAHSSAGRHRAALPLWRLAISRDARNLWSWYGLGNCYAQLEQHADAAACYTACIALKPDHAAWYFLRGLAYLRQQKWPQAISDFDENLRLEPGCSEARVNRALANVSRGRNSDALAELNVVIDAGGGTARTYLIRAHVRDGLGDAAGAELDRKQGLNLPGTDESTWIARGAARAKTDPAAALADMEQALKLNPASLPALENKAHLLAERLGRTADAVEVLGIALQSCPESAPVLAARAVLLARLERTDEALGDAEAALRADGSGAIVYQAGEAFALASRNAPEHRVRAISLLASAIRQGFGHDLIEQDPDLLTLREAPEFQKLVQSVRTVHALSK